MPYYLVAGCALSDDSNTYLMIGGGGGARGFLAVSYEKANNILNYLWELV